MTLKYHKSFILCFIFYRTVRTTCVYFLCRNALFRQKLRYAYKVSRYGFHTRISRIDTTNWALKSTLGAIVLRLCYMKTRCKTKADAAPTKATMSQKEKQPPRIESLKTVIVWYLPVIMGIRAQIRALKSSVHIKYRVGRESVPVKLFFAL